MENSLAGETNIYYDETGELGNNLSDFKVAKRVLNPEALYDFLLFGAVLPPRTVLSGVSSLFPGESLVTDSGLARKENKLFSGLAQVQPLEQPVDYFVDQLDTLLENYFGQLRASGKKICLFLSGGVDSGILASYLRPEDFCVTWAGWGEKTSDYARAKETAAHFHLKNHSVVYPDYSADEQLFSALTSRHLELFKLTAIAYYKLAKAAKDQLGQDTVCVTGDNADTLAGSFGEVVHSYQLSHVNKITGFFPWRWLYYRYRKLFLLSTDNPIALSAWLHSGGLFPSRSFVLPPDYFTRQKGQLEAQIGRPIVRFNDYIFMGMLMTGVVRQMSGLRSIINRELGLGFGLPFCSEEIAKLFLAVPDDLRRADHYGKIILKKLAAKRGLPDAFIHQAKKGMSYGHIEYFKTGRHLPIWQSMAKNDSLNQFINIKLARQRLENNFSAFDTLRSLHYYLNSNFPV